MKKLIALIMLSLLATSSGLYAGKIYKWTDAQGNVHYGAQAPVDNAQEIKLRKEAIAPAKPTKSDDKPGKQTEQAEDKDSFLEKLTREREEKAKADAVAAKEKARYDKNCSFARKNLASLKIGGRRFDVDEKGNRIFLEDKQIQQRQQAAQKDIQKWCQ